MDKKLIYIFLGILFITSCSNKMVRSYKGKSFKGKSIVDIYHGVSITDSYRNLENLKDSTVLDWLKAQNAYAENILTQIEGRDQLVEVQKEIENNKKHTVRQIRSLASGKYFYLKKFAGEDVFNLYYRDSLEGGEQKIFDITNYIKKTGKKDYLINYIKPNWKGSKIAISISKKGNEVSEIIVLDLAKKTILTNTYSNVAPASIGGIDWLSDDSGFISSYLPYIDPNDEKFWLNTKSYLYTLGKKVGKDIFSKDNNPEININIEDFPMVYNLSETDGYLFGQFLGKSSFMNIYYINESEIKKDNIRWNQLCSEEEKITQYKIDGEYIYYLTSKDTLSLEIRKTTIKNPNFKNAELVVASSPESVITDFEITKDGLFYVKVKNGIQARLFHKEEGNQEKEIMLPNTSGRIFLGSLGARYTDLWVTTRGWIQPSLTYKYKLRSNSFSKIELNRNKVPSGFENMVAEEIEITSHDGIKLPVSLIYKKGLKKDGQNRVLFYGYGAYGTPLSPFYSTSFLLWVKEGGIIVMPHVRGGGEKGDAWHKAGMKTTKSNTWKDLIATVEYMIAKRYTNPKKTVVWGTSAGGIMAGRAITERPDLFKVMIGISPSMNTMRSEHQPMGLNSIKEFGTLKDSLEFRGLLEMDAYHSIKKNEKYPAVLILAGLKDGRVVAWDPAKFIAKLLDYSTSNDPVLFQVNTESGHGGMNSSENKLYIDYANIYAFALWQTDHPDYKLNK